MTPLSSETRNEINNAWSRLRNEETNDRTHWMAVNKEMGDGGGSESSRLCVNSKNHKRSSESKSISKMW